MRSAFPKPLRDPRFRKLFLGRTVSLFGDNLVPVAIAFAVLDLTGSASDLGLVLAAETVTMVTFLLVGGVWGDRVARNRLMVASDLVRAGVQAVVVLILLSGWAQLWHLVVLMAIYGAAAAFFYPASTGLVPQTVEEDQLQPANALLGLSAGLTAVAGPAVAGVIVSLIGPAYAIGLDAVTFAVSALFLASLVIADVREPQPRRRFAEELRTGWGEFVSRTWLWVMGVHWALFLMLAFAPFAVLGPLIARRSLGGAAAWA